jgi:hypothetical protein
MLGTAEPAVPSQTQRQGMKVKKHREGVAVEGFILLALVAVYFVISYEQ